jgi:hypothetical protein
MDLFESISVDAENSTPNTADSSREASAESSGGISRRSVVKAGAAAAWTIPLVQVVAAAPAVAVSGAPQLAFTQKSATYSSSTELITVSLTLNNSGGDTYGLTVKLTLPSGYTGKANVTGGSWAVARAGSTYTFTAGTQLVGGTAATLSATIDVKSKTGPGTGIAVNAESYTPKAAMASTSMTVV